jgi:hypothetical protein
LECHEASGHHLLEFGFFLDSTNLGFSLRENLLLYSSYLPLGVPNWTVIYIITTTQSKDFSGAVAGEKEDFCKGSFARTSFTLF